MIKINENQRKSNSDIRRKAVSRKKTDSSQSRNHDHRQSDLTGKNTEAVRNGAGKTKKFQGKKAAMSARRQRAANNTVQVDQESKKSVEPAKKRVVRQNDWVISPPQGDLFQTVHTPASQKDQQGQKRRRSVDGRSASQNRGLGRPGLNLISKLGLLIVLVIVMIVLVIEGISACRHSQKEAESNEVQYSSSDSSVTSPISESTSYPEGTDPNTLGSLTQLINRKHGLPTDYLPSDLVKNELPGTRETYLRKEAAEALAELFAAAEEDGVSLLCCSGFRSYTDQQEVYANNVSSMGETEAYQTTAQPGFSEHQSGLAMDLTCDSVGRTLTTEFIHTTEGRWIDRNAWKYGFIVRYPNEMESITGYTYEPWHIRYLGKTIAKSVYKSGKTYEEFLGILD